MALSTTLRDGDRTFLPPIMLETGLSTEPECGNESS